jgi:penicillin amidase
MAHLQAPGLNVTGFSLPGLPGIVAGHNDRIAWSCTNLGFDVQDLVEIQIDERTGRYLHQGRPEQARPEQEVIRVRGGKPAEVMVWVTRHGPLFLAEGSQRFALRWTAEGVGANAFPFLDLNRARNWNEFNQALARFPGPAQTFVYADVDGNIGYHVAGKLPVRKGFAGDVPSSAQAAWEGFIPFDQLPSAFNPPSGMIISANQNPFPQDYPYTVSGSFAPRYRAVQIRNLLNAKKGWRAPDMLPVQMDVYSEFSRFLAREAVGAFDRRKPTNPQLPDAISLLRGWNGQMEYDIAPPFLASLLFQHVRRAIAVTAAPKGGSAYQTRMSAAVIERLLRERPAGWVKDWDETLIRALDDAVAEGSRMQGREPSRWKYGSYLPMQIRHPLGTRLPWYLTQPLQFWWIVTPWRSYENYKFDIGPEPMSGSATTIKAVSQRNMPSMRMIVDLGNLDSSLANIPTGQSGQILSPHYKDQWKSHYYGRSFPMEFRNVKAEDVLEFVPGLPAGK